VPELSRDHAVVIDDATIEYPAAHGNSRYQALNGVTMGVGRGEFLGLVGETGSGKSTLAQTLAGHTGKKAGEGATEIVGGSVKVLGNELRTLRPRVRARMSVTVGYLPQNAGQLLTPGSTVAENIGFPVLSRDRRFDRRQLGRMVAELIDAVHLPLGAMNSYPHELSGGQRQRVAIARSLILEPELWIADEPTSGIDVTVRQPVLDTVLAMQRDRGLSALIISHDAAITNRLTDRVAVLQRGQLIGLGRVDDVLAEPQHPYLKGLALEYEIATGPIRLPPAPPAPAA
jgi:peptide/nickel transport system ATP-binding protein